MPETYYAIIYEKTGTGYSAYVPDLPGCITTGPMRDDGEPIPEPTTVAVMLPVESIA